MGTSMIKSDFIESYIKLDQLSKKERRRVSVTGIVVILGLFLFLGGYLLGAFIVLAAIVCIVWYVTKIAIKAKK